MRCAACNDDWGPWGLYIGRMYCEQCLESGRAIAHAALCASFTVDFPSGRRLELPLSLRRRIFPTHIGTRRVLPPIELRGESAMVSWSGFGQLEVVAVIARDYQAAIPGLERRAFGRLQLRIPASKGMLHLSVIQRGKALLAIHASDVEQASSSDLTEGVVQ